MEEPEIYGYAAKILRVDLTEGSIRPETLDEATLRKYIGGTSLGSKFLYDEVPSGTQWSDPKNRLFVGSGPLGGTRIGGSGTVSVVTRGALTNGGASSQANGFFGAYLRFSGFDAIIVQGAAPSWVYLHIHDGTAELRDASRLVGEDTYETENSIRAELGRKAAGMSVLGIGPAGENLVKFALISCDMGHMAAHNGVGAVMGSKRLKAIAVDRGSRAIPIKDGQVLSRLASQIREATLKIGFYSVVSKEGTVGHVPIAYNVMGILPVKNYTTSVWGIDKDNMDAYTTQRIRSRFKARRKPCWACQFDHNSMLEISQGKYAGLVLEEPEYEGMAAWSSQVGIADVATSLALANAVDRLGMDTNEAGWVIGWVIECYEKGVLSQEDTDGLQMTWGNGEAIMAMLHKIAHRQGFGSILAEGAMRAAQHVGGEAVDMAVYTQKGDTPRTHDHRAQWLEMFDTCVSSTGTLETQSNCRFEQLGLSPTYDNTDPQVVSTVEARIKGAMIFEDCLGTCRFNTATNLDLLSQAVNAATGWDLDIEEAMTVGRRAVNLLRAFNLRNGIGSELDAPSTRYGSTPLDGPAAGRGIMPHWQAMLRNYYNLMGWDEKGRPLAETLKNLGLERVIPHLWG